ncbi:uncharacterized protein LOC111271932 [Varroa jacobsoni]|uniref:uncharacterized protein LOC111271932 n=1 Tax=Varroa jacobsoni TaxID=62625 RepID=UPI000BF28978|nr:uncharacterized protein LOC111271932 [Varroa jacobsoni]
MSQDEAEQETEATIDDGTSGSCALKGTYQLRRQPSPRMVVVHQQMARYLAAHRQNQQSHLLVDDEGALLLKMHAHRYGVTRLKRARIYLDVAVEAKLRGVPISFAYVRENLKALYSDVLPPEVSEKLLRLSQDAVLEGLCFWDRPNDEEALSTVVCFFETARRIAPNASVIRRFLKDVHVKLLEIFNSAETNTVERLCVNLDRLNCWTSIMDEVCPRYGDGKFSLLLENNFRDLILPHAEAIVRESLKQFPKYPRLAYEIVEVVVPLTRLSQLAPIDHDFKLWFTDKQTSSLINDILSVEQEDLLLLIGNLTDSNQEFTNRLQDCIKRCEHFVDTFMWHYVGLAGVYCRKLCDVFQALQARLWSIQIDAPTIRYCVQIDAIREIAFACDEVSAFLRLGSTGLCAEFEVAIREVQLKLETSLNALIAKLSARILKSKDLDMLTDLQNASGLIANVNPHDQPKLVVCIWKTFLFRIVEMERTNNECASDLIAESAVSNSISEFIEELFKICPHLEPNDLSSYER